MPGHPEAITLLYSTGKESWTDTKGTLLSWLTRQPDHTLSKSVGKTSDVSDDASRVPFLALDSTKTFKTCNMTNIDEHDLQLIPYMPAFLWAWCWKLVLSESPDWEQK